jgi:hypothetical protein
MPTESDPALSHISAARDALSALLATPRHERTRDAPLAAKALVDVAMAEEPTTPAARTARIRLLVAMQDFANEGAVADPAGAMLGAQFARLERAA